VLITALSMMFLAALQIAGPMVAVLLLADVALALLSRAAPALNIFAIGFPVKIMLTLALLGLTFPLLPPALDALLKQATRAIVSLKSG
jgi:flagellar biosynthetic protein FliR